MIRSVKPGRRRRQTTPEGAGLTIRSAALEDRIPHRLAWGPTIHTALVRPDFDRHRRPLPLSPPDLRQKIRERKTGRAVVFVLDASSSMRVRGRMPLVKGLLRAYLKECYFRRDRVALVSFRQEQSQLILPFTGNVSRAQKAVDRLPVGGKTPLAEGLRLGFRALLQERAQNPQADPVLVLVSDGKPNLSFQHMDPIDEALQTAAWLSRNGVTLVFIDTEDNPLAFGYGPAIARRARGVYRTMVDLLKKSSSPFAE